MQDDARASELSLSGTPPRRVAALIVAAGRGARAGRDGPKQYEDLGGAPVLRRTVDAFHAHPGVTDVLCVIHANDEERFARSVGGFFVHGGATRQASVRAGLETLADDPPDAVLIHDGARPLVTSDEIGAVIERLATRDGAMCALPVADTLTREENACAGPPIDREGLWRAQTPQGFRFNVILAAHRKAAAAGREVTDDASLLPGRVALVPGSAQNIKLTYPEDFVLAERLLPSPREETRTGLGLDVHAFGPGDSVTLCGVRVAHDAGLVGHSDADVGMHALTDALYGALGEGDIGRHFPPSEARWKGAASRVFLDHAAERLAARGGRLLSADVTLACETPKIAPHAEAMRARLAEILSCDVGRVSVKATTTERLGFTGRGEGILAQAVVSVGLPAGDAA